VHQTIKAEQNRKKTRASRCYERKIKSTIPRFWKRLGAKRCCLLRSLAQLAVASVPTGCRTRGVSVMPMSSEEKGRIAGLHMDGARAPLKQAALSSLTFVVLLVPRSVCATERIRGGCGNCWGVVESE